MEKIQAQGMGTSQKNQQKKPLKYYWIHVDVFKEGTNGTRL